MFQYDSSRLAPVENSGKTLGQKHQAPRLRRRLSSSKRGRIPLTTMQVYLGIVNLSKRCRDTAAEIMFKFTDKTGQDKETRRTLRVRFLLVTALPLSSPTLWPGRLIALDLKEVSVAFWAGANFLPTLCLAFLNAIPTPAFFAFFFAPALRGIP